MDYRVLKHNDVFMLTDQSGNIPKDHSYGLGLYKYDTRFLSELMMKINNVPLVLLSSNARHNYESTMLLTNPHMETDGVVELWRESIEVERKRYVYEGVYYEQIKLKSYAPKRVAFDFQMQLDVDFADMFVVRGFLGGELGAEEEPETSKQQLIRTYIGKDGVKRQAVMEWNLEAQSVEEGEISFSMELGHAEEIVLSLQVKPLVGDESVRSMDPEIALEQLRKEADSWKDSHTEVKTDYAPLQRLIDRGLKDMHVLLTDVGYGNLPVAGLPWFAVPFGRDSLIAALQMLPYERGLAKGTLRTMASMQGERVDHWRDEQPGKIMHEIRYGELASTGQIPFTPYYGTIDATPLFVILFTEYIGWTGDLDLARELLPNVEAAIKWMDEYGDRDGDGFVEYHQESSKGIANQGWKDSGDSIVHRNGDFAETPIALSEVQGYVYQAKRGLASVYEALGRKEKGAVLQEEAAFLKERYEQAFYMNDVNYYAIALDGDKQQVGTITSNPGHTLWADLVSQNRMDELVAMLTGEKMFSGYGIRTMAEGEAGYNPMSYHDGSVWPHDNSIILLGMGRQGYQDAAAKVMSGLVEASQHFEYDRLPELFCGYDRDMGHPVHYPIACSPQAWAAGTPLSFTQTMLGLYPSVIDEFITLHPFLLQGMNELHVSHLKVRDGELDLSVHRREEGYQVQIHKNTTGLPVHVNGSVMPT
ncbi:amylo-alpha-16-glucosidase [Pontibacillus halophilus JSM 076056 = DSM 19796]|uniref:Amylo-alpha-16-glucosidase n=1 Tax=Pontibacillus halophilus JSM 076056 = DSM 19796 TaxID=1385510 RepID=A0A0A5GNC6_9BACI|nr:amylo-alpha-1,6-glucosidase [Pontibacillus halophilus]KGX92753.1 amylo-alpha-16-glucosidase [Pontibacillus halophilus JSM 076056 = DSM 19796]